MLRVVTSFPQAEPHKFDTRLWAGAEGARSAVPLWDQKPVCLQGRPAQLRQVCGSTQVMHVVQKIPMSILRNSSLGWPHLAGAQPSLAIWVTLSVKNSW